MSRCIQVKFPLQLVYAATTTGTHNIPIAGYDSLRNLADMRIQLNTNISINGQSLPSQQVFDCLPDLLAHYKRDYRRNHPLGAIDPCQYLVDSIGSVNDPLGDYADTESFEGGSKRGSYAITGITRATDAGTVQLDLIGWLYVPELIGFEQNDLGFLRVRNFDVNMTLDLNEKKVCSSAILAGKPRDSVTVTITSSPTILCKFTTVPKSMLPVGPLSYNHLRIERFPTAYGALAINTSATITGNNIQLPAVPRYVWLFVRESDANKQKYDTDTFCQISKVNINFNGMVGIVSSASEFDLWNMSKDTGLIDSWEQFHGLSNKAFTTVGTVGSLVGLTFGKHIALGSGVDVGQAGAFNFNVEVTCKNINQDATYGPLTNATLYVVIGYDQTLVIDEGGLISLETPLARGHEGDMVAVPYHNGFDSPMVGGSVRSFFKKVLGFVRDNKLVSRVSKAISPFLNAIPGVGPAISNVASTVGNLAEKVGYGGKVIAGSVMSQAEMRKQLAHL